MKTRLKCIEIGAFTLMNYFSSETQYKCLLQHNEIKIDGGAGHISRSEGDILVCMHRSRDPLATDNCHEVIGTTTHSKSEMEYVHPSTRYTSEVIYLRRQMIRP